MQVIDEITRKIVNVDDATLAVIHHSSEQLVSGYISDYDKVIPVLIYHDGGFKHFMAYLPTMKDQLIFSKQRGIYLSEVDLPENIRLKETSIMGTGGFPYRFDRKYEAIENFRIFDGKQKVLKSTSHQIAKHLKYTFGIEFETSQGFIPEDICFRDGLIPLRDGSIGGLEYSTVVMSKNKGICLLKQQLKTLNEYTTFNKECSLHMHFGGFPIEPQPLYRLYYLFKKLEDSIELITPPLTFHSDQYKETGKNYCKKLPIFRNFEHMYNCLVGRPFFGSLTQPHPKDVDRRRKWNISTRYYALNFINALCYDVNKTIEFRFLRPTFNFNKIILWMYIFNAMMIYAEEHTNLDYYPSDLKALIYAVYQSPLADAIYEGITKLSILRCNQVTNGDNCGRDVYLEDRLFTGKMNY